MDELNKGYTGSNAECEFERKQGCWLIHTCSFDLPSQKNMVYYLYGTSAWNSRILFLEFLVALLFVSQKINQ